jgi:hypothetical protein
MEPIVRVASATSTTAIRPLTPGSDLGFTAGQTIHARVTRVEGDAVQLRWGDQTVSVASEIPLSIGQHVSLQVEEGSGGKMLLRMIDETFGRGRPDRLPGNGHGSSPDMPAGGRRGAAGVHGSAAQAADITLDDLAFWGADGDANGLGGPAGRPLGTMPQARTGGAGPGPLTGGLLARAALPTYGKLAQSVGGTAAFSQVMAALGHDVGKAFALAPLAPADLGRLLIDVGVHPDETNTVLVGEVLTQGAAVNEGSIRRLRRGLTAAGGSLSDAAPAVTLSRLGLPITPLSLAVARQMQAGQLDPKAAWGELLADLKGLVRDAGAGSQAGMLAAELLAGWRVPLEDGADGIARWLRTAVDQAATPLEAKLARTLASPGAEHGTVTTPGQDVRARLDLLAQALPDSARGDRGSLAQSLQRTQATMQAEQILNGAATERAEQRYFAVTLPTVTGQQHPSTLELRVRERDAQKRANGEVVQPDVVQMKLSLPGLGDLGVSLMVGQHSVSCHFSAGSAFSEALLSASSGELVGRLKRLGFAHTAVDAAHEPMQTPAPPLAAAPRVGRVDMKA